MREDLQQWLDFALVLDSIYQQELGRSCFSDPQAFVNWTYHWSRDESPDWVRDRIRESQEWVNKHGGVVPEPQRPQPPVDPGEPLHPPSHPPRLGQPIRITDEREGIIPPRMYSYWSNAVVLGDYVFIFCGNADGIARFFKVHPDDTVERLPNYIGDFRGETEGWYWRPDGRLYVFNVGGDELVCVNPFNVAERQTVLKLDGKYAGGNIWQPHSSDDGRTHVATVKDSNWRKVAMAMSVDGRMSYAPAFGDLDETHISGDGRTAIMEEDNNTRIVDVASGRERLILNQDGALAHLDCGPNYMVGEDDQIGACVNQNLETLARTILFNTWGMGHVSVRNGVCLLSRMEPENDICLVGLNGEGLTPVLQHGMVTPANASNEVKYNHQVKANMDFTARVFIFMSNMGGGRQDVYMVRLS